MSQRGSRPTSQMEVEAALLAEVDHLEALTNGGIDPGTGQAVMGFDEVCALAAETEADWKIEQAKSMIAQAARTVNGRPEAKHTQEARVLAVKADLYRMYKRAGAVREAHKEALVTSRSRIDALRTIAANVRAQT